MAAAVHRSADDREPWNPAESLTPAEALAASTDGQPTLGEGSRGDIVLLDADPVGAAPDLEGRHAYSAECAWLPRSSGVESPISRCRSAGSDTQQDLTFGRDPV